MRGIASKYRSLVVLASLFIFMYLLGIVQVKVRAVASERESIATKLRPAIENCSHGTFNRFQTCEITPLTRDFSV